MSSSFSVSSSSFSISSSSSSLSAYATQVEIDECFDKGQYVDSTIYTCDRCRKCNVDGCYHLPKGDWNSSNLSSIDLCLECVTTIRAYRLFIEKVKISKVNPSPTTVLSCPPSLTRMEASFNSTHFVTRMLASFNSQTRSSLPSSLGATMMMVSMNAPNKKESDHLKRKKIES
ncbi:MAG: hypothetical protein Sylvanvirus13_3 [Sylvanvirus sp.]|uniref:Uncharacterized protein n=1 Tax=Sylvanvirus sp. TaxID=2487774 RepID=A0A3G5AIA0_9VIRU|nr:MAG: hypothetical protein Sylvanvirus13_3 [Sylvanvirus sp.]